METRRPEPRKGRSRQSEAEGEGVVGCRRAPVSGHSASPDTAPGVLEAPKPRRRRTAARTGCEGACLHYAALECVSAAWVASVRRPEAFGGARDARGGGEAEIRIHHSWRRAMKM